MRATILGLADRSVGDPHVETHLEANTYPAINATAYERLDGGAIYAGNAAGRIDVETEHVFVTEDAIGTERDEERETAYCEWIADLGNDDQAWLGVNRSAGDWLFDAIGATKGVQIHRATIDIDGFADYLSDYPSASAWNTTQSRSLDADDEAEEAVISYHDAARLSDTGGSRETSMLGFEYHREEYRRGVVSESGYVALFDGGDKPSLFAEFINTEILPFAELPEEYQGTLAEAAGEEEVAADGE